MKGPHPPVRALHARVATNGVSGCGALHSVLSGGGSAAGGRVQRPVPEQVDAVAVPVEAGRYPGQPLAVDGPAGTGETVHLGAQPRALNVIRDGAAVAGHLVGLQTPAPTGD